MSKLSTNTRLQLHETADYTKFLYNKVQRATDKGLVNHIKRLAQSMQEWGFLPSKCIHVVPDHGKLRVIDGHNRLEAAKRAKVPVVYQIGQEKEAGAMMDINNNTKVWAMRNYIQAHAAKGNQNYVALMEYHEKGIPFNIAASLLIGQAALSSNVRSLLPCGDFVIKDRTTIDKLVDFMDRAPKECKELRSNSYIGGVVAMLDVDEFDINKFLRKLSANPRAVVKVACRDQALEVIEEIHNHHSSSKPNLAYIAKQILDSRNVAKKAS